MAQQMGRDHADSGQVAHNEKNEENMLFFFTKQKHTPHRSSPGKLGLEALFSTGASAPPVSVQDDQRRRSLRSLASVDFGMGVAMMKSEEPVIHAFTKTLGWVPICKKCWAVTGQNSLDAELGGCGMQLENLRPWIDNSVLTTNTNHYC